MKHYVKEIKLSTPKEDYIDISNLVDDALVESKIKNGHLVIFTPHTTAGITINENADPDVITDMLFALDKVYPQRPEFRHFEGNSPAHLKSSSVGNDQTVIVKDGQMILGIWQGIYFCEFDGPRNRRFIVSVLGE